MDRSAYINRRLRIAVITPIVLLVIAGAVLTYQIARLVDAAKWVDHTDQVIATTNQAETLVADQEALLRGFLLTHDDQFMRAFSRSPTRSTLAQLRALAIDNHAQTERINEIERLYELWLPDAATLTGTSDAIHAREGKMDDLRAGFRALLDEEYRLRRERSQVLETANTTSSIVAIVMLIVLAASLALVSRKQLSDITTTYVEALDAEQKNRIEIEAQATLRASLVRIVEVMQGDLGIDEMSALALRELAASTGAEVGAFYTSDGSTFRLSAGLALRDDAPKTIAMGEGVVGECARRKTVMRLRDVPPAYLEIASATGHHDAVSVVLVPAIADRVVHAVIELGFLRPIGSNESALLERASETIGMAVRSAMLTARLHELLEESRRQAEELQTQQEELRAVNEELQQQSDEVVRASRYKSEFLANMSHELRTPLNSLLILAKLLGDNKTRNLSAEQVEDVRTIHSAGKDLLTLIDDILDLAKIEAGKVSFEYTQTTLRELIDPITRLFVPIAKEKNIEVDVDVEEADARTDVKRVRQILKNLLANAFKFTPNGRVMVRARASGETIEIAVTDTGIGIPATEHQRIFEAFEQVNASTTRRFAGSGLGLSISRDLARGLGGELSVQSTIGKGSTFTLRLPTTGEVSLKSAARILVVDADGEQRKAISALLAKPGVEVASVDTARDASTQLALSTFDCVVTDLDLSDAGDLGAVSVLASTATALPPIIVYTGRALTPAAEIALRGKVAAVIIKGARSHERLVDEVATALRGHEQRPRARMRTLPRTRESDAAFEGRTILIAEDDVRSVFALSSLLERHGATVLIARTGREALEIVEADKEKIDLVLMDLMMPEVDGLTAIQQMRASGGTLAKLPIIAITAKAMPDDHEQCLRAGANDYVAKPFDADMVVSLARVWMQEGESK